MKLRSLVFIALAALMAASLWFLAGPVHTFLAQDRCADGGGVWLEERGACACTRQEVDTFEGAARETRIEACKAHHGLD